MRPMLSAVLAGCAGLAALAGPASPAVAHPIEARLSPSGLEFLEAQILDYVPTRLFPPPLTQILVSCSSTRQISFTQRNTTVDLRVERLDLSIPVEGTLRVDLTLDARATGEAYIDNVYACFGETTCRDDLAVEDARAILDFDARVVGGRVRVSVRQVELDLAPEDLDLAFDGCAIDGIVNFVVDGAKGLLWDYLVTKLEEVAAAEVGPRLEAMLDGFARYDGVVGSARFDAALTGVSLGTTGLGVSADVDLSTRYPLDACLSSDPGQPPTHEGARPDLAAGRDAHVGLAVNLGLVDDALYHLWHEGLMCLDQEGLRSLGLDLDLASVAHLLPGLPHDAALRLDLVAQKPPRVRAQEDDAATLRLELERVVAELSADLPDGTSRRLRLDLDASAIASVALDPAINALTLRMGAVTLSRLDVDDGLDLAALGFDYARIHQLLEENVLPAVVGELGRIPVTGPIFGLADYYVILRDVRTTSAFLVAKADLFRAPETDVGAPDTRIVSRPERIVRPADAILRVDGSDPEIPPELLRFRVEVDGRATGDPSYVRELRVGEAGRTATYQVAVSAVDLHGNVDPTPARAEVTVDGVPPRLRIFTRLEGEIDTPSPTLEWGMEDDLSPPERMTARIEVFRMDPGPRLDQGELVAERDLGAGATTATLDLAPGAEYRVVVNVYDEAQNRASESRIFAIPGDGACACAVPGRPVEGTGAPGAGALLVLLVFLGVRGVRLLIRDRR